ncbi:29990_t:CDS:2, partial [Racocetra persica]
VVEIKENMDPMWTDNDEVKEMQSQCQTQINVKPKPNMKNRKSNLNAKRGKANECKERKASESKKKKASKSKERNQRMQRR